MKVLYWDPRAFGHHYRYLQAIAESAPESTALIVPTWFRDEVSPPRSLSTVEQQLHHEYESMASTIVTHRPDAVIIGHGNEIARRLALASRPPKATFVIVDLRCAIARLDRQYRASSLDGTRAMADLAHRELAVRRLRIRYLSLIPAAVRGSSMLRSHSGHFPDPLEVLDRHPASPTSRDRVRISLPGVLARKKGVADLAKAVTRLPASSRARIEVVFAGETDISGEAELADAVSILSRSDVSHRVVRRRLNRDELGSLLGTSDVVALPYRSHQGGSGVLGTTLATSTAQVVISDFGWPGELGRQLGAITHRNLDVEDLAQKLELAISEGPRADVLPLNAFRGLYGTPAEFGRVVWRAVAEGTTQP